MGKARSKINLFWWVNGLLFLWFLFVYDPVWGQTAVENIVITDISTEQFPQLNVRLRALGERNLPVETVLNNDLQLFEDNEEIVSTALELRQVDAGIRVHFVVDAGFRITNDSEKILWQRTVEAVTDFVQTTPWMKENLDQVAITAVEANGLKSIVDFNSHGDTIVNALNAYQIPLPQAPLISGSGETQIVQQRGYSDPLTYIDRLLTEMSTLPEAQKQAQLIVLITPGLESGQSYIIDYVAQQAKNASIPIYTYLVRNANTEGNLGDLANQSGGLFASFFDATNLELDGLFRDMVHHRTQYAISYRSKVNSAGIHQVEVRFPSGVGGALADASSYDIELSEPRVVLEKPEIGERIVREASAYVANSDNIEPTSYTVVATVIFPDGYERELISAELLINGASAGLIRNPSTRIEIPWNLRSIKTLGTTDLTVQVEVRDELGLVANNQPAIVSAELIIPKQATEEGVGAEEAIKNIVDKALIERPTPCTLPRFLCTFQPYLSYINLGLVVVLLGTTGFLWRNRSRVVEAGGRVGGAVTSFVERVTGRRVQATPRAYLVVLEGDNNVGRSLEIYGDTPLGRSKQYAELLFQSNDENSPLSRLHCTLVDEEDRFLIRDEDSANGTFLNGMRLKPLQEEHLQDGDEIELAQVERGGVKLLFQLAVAPGVGVPDSSRQTNPVLSQSPNDGLDSDEDDF